MLRYAISQPVMAIANETDKSSLPIFVKTIVDGREVFFLAKMGQSDIRKELLWLRFS